MGKFLGKTESLCPVCLGKVHATKVREGDNVYLEKKCEDHGSYRAIIWHGDADRYEDFFRFDVEAVPPKIRHTKVERGCPHDCGICPVHKQDICMVVMEVNNRCNLSCFFCFADADPAYIYEPDLNLIEEMYKTVLKSSRRPICLQISGGEPTLRDDLPDIVALGKDMGIDHIEVNTNGIRLAKDIDYLRRLKESGTNVLYFSFDGVTGDVWRRICGTDLLNLKVRAIENCAEVGIGMVLVTRLIPDINYHQVGDIIQFAKKWIPTVKGVHFQPINYVGRYPNQPGDEDRVTTPDVLRAVEEQTKGELKVENFIPGSCSRPHCEVRSLSILMENGRLFPLTQYSAGVACKEDVPYHVRKQVSDLWVWKCIWPEETGESKEVKTASGSWAELVKRAQTHYLTVSLMPFQDVWNIELERLEKCCIYEVTPDKRIIPFCLFNVSSVDDRTLYRHEILSKYAKV